MPGYNFYSFMDELAEQAELLSLNVAVDQQALVLLSSSGDVLLRAEEHRRLARAAAKAGMHKVGEENFVIASRLLSSAPKTEVTENYRAESEIELAQLDTQQNSLDIAAARLGRVDPQVARISNRYVTSEYYEALGDLRIAEGQLREAETAFSTAIRATEQELGSLRSEQDRISWARQASPAYDRMVELKLAQRDPLTALSVLEMYRGASIRGVSPGAPIAQTTSAAPLQTREPWMDPPGAIADIIKRSTAVRVTLLVYAALPHGLVVWISDERGFEAREIRSDVAPFLTISRYFTDICRKPSSQLSTVQDVSRQLYELLITPLSDRLEAGRPLLIETDGALGEIPFQALMDASNHYLIEHHPVIYIPSILYIAHRDEPETFRPPVRALVLGNNASSIGLSPLPDAEQEARDVAQRLPNPHLLIGSQATLSAVEAELPRANLFHFAGHAIRGKASGLRLAGDGAQGFDVLSSSELQGINLANLRLAVLSACATGNGEEGGAADWESLARGFLAAGVPHVIASRWDVDSSSSRTLMRAFYEDLLSGDSVGQSLATAELLLMHNPQTAHPFYWAAFDLFGGN